MHLKAAGLAQEDPNKKKRLKWVRDERKHSYPPAISIGRSGMEPASVKELSILRQMGSWKISGEYKRHRHAFLSFEEFIEWYNNRPDGSLEFEKV
jgi:hypothetical protein